MVIYLRPFEEVRRCKIFNREEGRKGGPTHFKQIMPRAEDHPWLAMFLLSSPPPC